MKKFIALYLVLFSTIFSQVLNRNIDQFKISSFVRPVSSDSIEILSFMEVSNNTLQFLKKDGLFEAQYEANIVILDKEKEKKSSKLFSDKIVVKKFGETTSRVKKKVITTAFVLPFDNYTVTSSLKDLDIKLLGKKEKEIDLKNLSKSTFFKIYDPIFTKELKGEWGFDANRFPIESSRVVPKDNVISFYQYIVLNQGEYTLTLSLISDKKVEWEDSIKAVADSDVVNHLIEIPIADVDRRDVKIKAVVNQGKNTASKSFIFKIKNATFFDGISNIDSALDQMSYILTLDEKKE